MLSTGEVACFGENYMEAYLKALVATGFKVHNKCNVLVSVGLDIDRLELLRYIKLLSMNGFTLYATPGTAEYYKHQGVKITSLEAIEICNQIKLGLFGLVINISAGDKVKTTHKSNGYYIRRLSVDYGIDIIINIKNAKLYIDSVVKYYNNFKVIGDCDLKVS